MSLQSYVPAILLGKAASVGVDPPRLTAAERRSLTRALARHGCPPWEGADKRAEAEGFELFEAPLPRRCGAHDVRRGHIFLSPGIDPHELDLVIDHERVHGWIFRRGLEHATEADAWMVTAEAVWPRNALRPLGFPDWFLDVVEIVRDPGREAVIGKVLMGA